MKNTIEFRGSNGTTDSEVWIDNINLYGGLVYIAKMISDIQSKSFGQMSDDEKLKLYFFEKLKDNNISERDKLKYLLYLMPSGVDKNVYFDRYDINSDLVDKMNFSILEGATSFNVMKITQCDEKLKKLIDDNCKLLIKNEIRGKRLS